MAGAVALAPVHEQASKVLRSNLRLDEATHGFLGKGVSGGKAGLPVPATNGDD